MLKIPRSTYYGYRHWQPSKTACRRQLIKQQLLSLWLKCPMYGYPRLTVALYQMLGLKVIQWLVYRLMKELGIRSRMVRRIRKPKTHTEYPQRPNLIRNLADQPVIIHSDMGSQYTSALFESTLTEAGIKHSYSRQRCPGDNARIESFHSLLKREYVSSHSFKNVHEAIAGIYRYIRWYNQERISSVA